MAAPFFSTFTLFTELFITAIILYAFHSGYHKNKLPYGWLGFALAYEVIFNISYMTLRLFSHSQPISEEPLYKIILAAFHGTISLVMFIALIVFMIIAWKHYKKGENYFKKHKRLTLAFIIFWLIAVASGIVFYVAVYYF